MGTYCSRGKYQRFAEHAYLYEHKSSADKKNILIIQPSYFTKNTFFFTAMASGSERRVREGCSQTPTQHQGTTEHSHNPTLLRTRGVAGTVPCSKTTGGRQCDAVTAE